MAENQKKIWITGASSGIGKALAEKFASRGWKVAVSARRKEILDKMSDHDNIFSFPLDVTNQDQINENFLKIIKEFNGIDLCVFSSGTYDPKLEQKINIKQNKFVMETNFFGVLYCIKAVEKYFKEKKSGHISVCNTIAQTGVGSFHIEKGNDFLYRYGHPANANVTGASKADP